jgi:hypothetical protein
MYVAPAANATGGAPMTRPDQACEIVDMCVQAIDQTRNVRGR